MDALLEFLIYQPWWAIYLVIFLILLLCGLGLPIPEDIILFTMGYCAYSGLADVKIGILVCMVGVLIGDSTIYFLGATYGKKLTQRPPFSHVFPPERMEKTKTLFHKWGNKVVFVARFMPGLRAPIYFSAGTLHLPFKIFIAFDFLASLISVPLLVYAMYRFGSHVDLVIKKAHEIQGGIAIVILLVVVLLVGKHYYLQKKDNAKS